jgi:hypothetical protein
MRGVRGWTKQRLLPLIIAGAVGVLGGMVLQRTRTTTQPATYNLDTAYADTAPNSAEAKNPPAPYEVPDEQPLPTISIEVTKDHKEGYNLFLDVANHTFKPQEASHEQKPGEGHAHLYIDGKKITRLYSTAYYLGNSFTKGDHVIQVALSTNNHRELQEHGQPIKATAILKVE